MTTTATVPTTAGMLVPGDRFSQLHSTTIFQVEDLSQNPLDEDEIAVTVTTWTGEDRGTQVFPLHFDHELVRWLA